MEFYPSYNTSGSNYYCSKRPWIHGDLSSQTKEEEMKLPRIKQSLLVLSFCLLAAGIAGSALAHPPGDIILEFDNGTKVLKIEVVHPVGSVDRHFVRKLQVFVDGKLMIVQNFNRQSTKKAQQVSYVLIDASVGNEIVVQAECNIYGSLEKKMTLQSQDEK